jgi:hypothetical protein
MLISLSTTSLIGQAVNNTDIVKPYLTTNSLGDTVVNNLPISFVTKANVEHQKFVNCQEDLENCNTQVSKLNQRSILYKQDLADAEKEKKILESQKRDLKYALEISKQNTATLETKLNKQIKIRNVLIPFVTTTTVVSGLMTTLYFVQRK